MRRLDSRIQRGSIDINDGVVPLLLYGDSLTLDVTSHVQELFLHLLEMFGPLGGRRGSRWGGGVVDNQNRRLFLGFVWEVYQDIVRFLELLDPTDKWLV